MTLTELTHALFEKMDGTLIVWVNAYGLWVYALLALIVFLETNVLGALLPGDSLVISTGVVCAGTKMDSHTAIIAIMVGTIAGFFVNYWLGVLLSDRFLKNKDIGWTHNAKIQKARAIIARYAAASILFSRFIPFMRSVAAMTAGLVRMDFKIFSIYSTLGGILWAVGCFSVDYLVTKFTVLSGKFWLLPIVVILLCIPAWGAKKLYTRLGEHRAHAPSDHNE